MFKVFFNSLSFHSFFIMYFFSAFFLSFFLFNFLNYFLVYVFFFFISLLYFFIILKDNLIFGFSSFYKSSFYGASFLFFILSECMVFFSLFWSHFFNFFSSNSIFGMFWPPKGFNSSNPFGLIIFGSFILLSSSFIIMISHFKLMMNFDFFFFFFFFLFNISLGMIFLDIQFVELSSCFFNLMFDFNDSVFSNSFIFTICLHSSHVFLGILLLLFFLFFSFFFSSSFFFFMSFDMVVWYWHFVDYVWIFVFSFFYYFNV